LRWDMVLVYLDDIVIFSNTFDSHLLHLELVLTTLQRAGLKAKLQKCSFAHAELLYLGHLVSGGGIRPDPAKVAALEQYKSPRTLHELRSFLGFASYYRRFISRFAHRAAPLYELLRKNVAWDWTDQRHAAFLDLKSALSSRPLLRHYVSGYPTIVHTDASGTGLGAVLLQRHPDMSLRMLVDV